MSSLIETIRERQNVVGLMPHEIEHFVLTTVAAALDMAMNAIDNSVPFEHHEMIGNAVDPDQIIAQLKEDFTESVQQYWPFHPTDIPGLVSHFDASNPNDWPAITRADVAKAHSIAPSPERNAELLSDWAKRRDEQERDDGDDLQSLMDRDRE